MKLRKAAFTPGHTLPDTSCIHLYPLVAVNIVSCIGDTIVASLSPVCCWIQRDTSRSWHKWIVILSPRYSQHVSQTSNLYPATCVQCLSTYTYPDTSCSSGTHVGGQLHVSWCKRGLRSNAMEPRRQHWMIWKANVIRYQRPMSGADPGL